MIPFFRKDLDEQAKACEKEAFRSNVALTSWGSNEFLPPRWMLK